MKTIAEDFVDKAELAMRAGKISRSDLKLIRRSVTRWFINPPEGVNWQVHLRNEQKLHELKQIVFA